MVLEIGKEKMNKDQQNILIVILTFIMIVTILMSCSYLIGKERGRQEVIESAYSAGYMGAGDVWIERHIMAEHFLKGGE